MRFPIGIFTNRKAIAPITEAMAFMLLNGYFWVVLIRGDPFPMGSFLPGKGFFMLSGGVFLQGGHGAAGEKCAGKGRLLN